MQGNYWTRFRRYVLNAAVAFDRLLNALLGGDPEMTVSGRMGRAIANGHCRLCRPVCWVLGKLDRDHCAKQAAREWREGGDQITPV